MVVFFEKDAQFEFELVRTMGQTAYGCAEIGECLATAERIVEGDYDSWHTEWFDTATWIYDQAVDAVDRHPISARDGFLRASNYFRTAEFFLHGSPEDNRIRATSRLSVESFTRAAAFNEPGIEVVSIPYEGTYLPGYFFRGAGSPTERKPTVLIHNGFDGTAEEIYAFGGRGGQERGYNILAFEGPGQGQVIREQGLKFRPDWEKVVSPVIDFVQARDDVDTNKIALIGISMGGVLTPRAAAFEHRLGAIVAWDGVYDMATVPLDVIFGAHPDSKAVLSKRFRADADPDLDAFIEQRTKDSGTIRWIVDHGSWVMGVDSPRQLMARLGDFTVKDGVAEQITCPVLNLDAEEDSNLSGQPTLLAKHLTSPVTQYTFTKHRGGHLHNQVDVFRHATTIIYNWLDETFKAESGRQE
jgi:alpha-beta hydrolase superfamily lysophospholipase